MRALISTAEGIAAGTVRGADFPLRPGEALVGIAPGNLHEKLTVPGMNGQPPKHTMKKVASGTVSVTTQRIVFAGAGRRKEWEFARLLRRPDFRKRSTTIELPEHGSPRLTAVSVADRAQLPVFFELALAIADHGAPETADAYRRALNRDRSGGRTRRLDQRHSGSRRAYGRGHHRRAEGPFEAGSSDGEGLGPALDIEPPAGVRRAVHHHHPEPVGHRAAPLADPGSRARTDDRQAAHHGRR